MVRRLQEADLSIQPPAVFRCGIAPAVHVMRKHLEALFHLYICKVDCFLQFMALAKREEAERIVMEK